MGMMKEFKEFAMRGSLVDIAVGFVMGAAFAKIVSAFVDGMVMPVVGLLTSGQDFSKMKYVLKEAIGDKPEIAILYGTFLTVVLDFIIVAFVMFMVIKALNASKKKEAEAPAAPPAPTTDQQLLMEIRDALKK
ncbi:MAG: large-conductance mechanosensitive channel protein MscL [Bacteroidota bacterium]